MTNSLDRKMVADWAQRDRTANKWTRRSKASRGHGNKTTNCEHRVLPKVKIPTDAHMDTPTAVAVIRSLIKNSPPQVAEWFINDVCEDRADFNNKAATWFAEQGHLYEACAFAQFARLLPAERAFYLSDGLSVDLMAAMVLERRLAMRSTP